MEDSGYRAGFELGQRIANLPLESGRLLGVERWEMRGQQG